uniref:neuronal acetylcholine receptor subunit beta-3-like n=1 Tax=Myxine glutinosa TaxID=7769 RepID=UPI00358F077A
MYLKRDLFQVHLHNIDIQDSGRRGAAVSFPRIIRATFDLLFKWISGHQTPDINCHTFESALTPGRAAMAWSSAIWIFPFLLITAMGTTLERLIEHLMSNYKKNVIPAPENESLRINLTVALLDVTNAELKYQRIGVVFHLLQQWNDPRLSWNQGVFGLDGIALPISDLWIPDLLITENRKI